MSEKDRKQPPQPPHDPPDTSGEMPDVSDPDDVLPGIVTGADIEVAVRGADYPATAKDLLERARRNGVDENVIQRLTDLPERRYTSLGDTLRALDMLS